VKTFQQTMSEILTGIAAVIGALTAFFAGVFAVYKGVSEIRRIEQKNADERKQTSEKLGISTNKSWSEMFTEYAEKADARMERLLTRMDKMSEENEKKSLGIITLQQQRLAADEQQKKNTAEIEKMSDKIVYLEKDNERLTEENAHKQAEIDRLNERIKELEQRVVALGGQP